MTLRYWSIWAQEVLPGALHKMIAASASTFWSCSVGMFISPDWNSSIRRLPVYPCGCFTSGSSGFPVVWVCLLRKIFLRWNITDRPGAKQCDATRHGEDSPVNVGSSVAHQKGTEQPCLPGGGEKNKKIHVKGTQKNTNVTATFKINCKKSTVALRFFIDSWRICLKFYRIRRKEPQRKASKCQDLYDSVHTNKLFRSSFWTSKFLQMNVFKLAQLGPG